MTSYTVDAPAMPTPAGSVAPLPGLAPERSAFAGAYGCIGRFCDAEAESKRDEAPESQPGPSYAV